jgi:chemotaxis protein histidine kinase CheA
VEWQSGFIFQSLDHESEEYSALRSAMNVVFGETDLQWELSEEYFPRRIILTSSNEFSSRDNYERVEKILKVACVPIWNDEKLLDRIMFVVEDVTELEKLERRIAKEKAQGSRTLQIVHELISIKRKDVFEFITSSQKTILQFKKSVANSNLDSGSLNNLMQILHTVKGNARLVGFTFISSTVHKVEALVIQVQEQLQDRPQLWNEVKDHLDGPINQVMYAIGEYQVMTKKLYGIENSFVEDSETPLEIDAIQLKNLKDLVTSEKILPTAGSLNKIYEAVVRLNDISISKEFEKYSSIIKQMASDLGKEVDFNITSENCLVDREKFPLIKDAIIHLLRNAIDHGIEFPEVRKSMGKSTTGLLKLILKKTEHKLIAWISDDGQGIDHDYVAAKACAKQLITQNEIEQFTREEVLDLIFLPNFSTREEATEVSGRGIGMDVVRTNIQKLGGNISIETKKGKGTLFKITVPNASFA